MPRKTISKQKIESLYRRRQARTAHPIDSFDRAGRFYPDPVNEEASCCKLIRRPSRAHPYSLMVHCRTKKHLTTLAEEKPNSRVWK